MTVLRCRLLTPASPNAVRWISDARVEFLDGEIVSVGPWTGGLCDEDLRPAVMVPGFVDAHLHFPQTRIVGSASGPLLTWLEKSTFPEEARFANFEHAKRVADLFCERLLGAGTTFAMAYGSVHFDATQFLFEALERSGLRAIAGPVLMDAHSPPELTVGVEPAMEGLIDLAERWSDHPRLQVAAIPRFALSCTEAMLQRAGEVAAERGLWVTTHLSENEVECQVANERFGSADYLQIYEDAGLVHARSVYAHCIHLSDSELDRMAKAGAVIAHCPDSNDFLGSGGMPLARILERKIPIAIGSDIAAGRSFRIPRILSSAYDNALRQGVDLDPRLALWWGTRGGALALGQETLGALEPGMAADMVAWDVPEWVASEDEALGWLLFDHDGRALRTWVGGTPTWDARTGVLGPTEA